MHSFIFLRKPSIVVFFCLLGIVFAFEAVPLESLVSHQAGHSRRIPSDRTGHVTLPALQPPRNALLKLGIKPLRSGSCHCAPRIRVTYFPSITGTVLFRIPFHICSTKWRIYLT